MPVVTICKQNICQASCSSEPDVCSLSLEGRWLLLLWLALVAAYEREAGDALW